MTTARRSLAITEDLVRAYSRRGNYHSDASEAERLGIPGLLAQGTQAMGPAYGILLDTWGEAFLAGGEIDVRFTGMVFAGQTVDATVVIADDSAEGATVEVRNRDTGNLAVVGRARLRAR